MSNPEHLPPRPEGAIDTIQELLMRRLAIGKSQAFYQNFITEHQQLVLVPEQPKCNAEAAKYRNVGNRLYLGRQYDKALVSYNVSICFAEVGSEQLGMGYGNRSAVYYEQGEYEFALYNIALAKKHRYPERLMGKLLAREDNCRQQIADGRSKGTVPNPRMGVNLETNPRMPFLAKGIKVDSRGVFIAEKDFNPGDVIVDEEPLLTAVDFNLCFEKCSHCGVGFSKSLIPCTKCVYFMYCSEECLQKSWKLYHRFECPVATKLRNFCSFSLLTTPRLFFYGLSLFNDNFEEMIRFCKTNEGADSNSFKLDHSELDRRELFRIIHNTKPRRDAIGEKNGYLEEKLISFGYFLIFKTNPLLQSIAASHRNLMIQTFNNYARLTTTLVSNTYDYIGRMISSIFPALPIKNHSCDPNAHTAFESGRMKMILLRPVRTGDPITESFRQTWWDPTIENPLKLSCNCVCSDTGPAGQAWRRQLLRPVPARMLDDFGRVAQILSAESINIAAKLNALQQFIKRNHHVHPVKQLGDVLMHYRGLLTNAIHAEREALDRARLQLEYC